MKVVTDFIACALEIRRGIDFERFNQDDAFLAVFMAAVALVNVHISSGIYLLLATCVVIHFNSVTTWLQLSLLCTTNMVRRRPR